MMTASPNYFSPDQYLQWEEHQEEKHEYVDGQVFARAGASENHSKKFAHYQTIETLKEYVLVSQWEKRVEVFRRTDNRFWLLQPFTQDQRMELQSINLQIPAPMIYEGVDLTPTYKS